MALKELINNDLKAALLGGDRFKGEVLRGLKAVILDEEVLQNKRDEGLDDELIEKLIAREVKKRRESAQIFKQADRTDLFDEETKQAEIISGYLPQQLSESEILVAVNEAIQELKATDMTMMGQVIGLVKKNLGNSADGSIIANLVKKILSSK